MPLFPCFAALVGIAVDRMAAIPASECPQLWNRFLKSMSAIMAGAAVVVMAVSIIQPTSVISMSIPGALGFAALASGLAYVCNGQSKAATVNTFTLGTFCVGLFMALLQVGPITSVQQHRCEDIEGNVKRIRQELPVGTELVSLGQVHHAFAFFYENPIPIVPLNQDLPNEHEYFCLHTYDSDPPELQFDWEQIAVISCDRFKELAIPKDRVFIGRKKIDRLNPTTLTTSVTE
jgi:hypothetical protein